MPNHRSTGKLAATGRYELRDSLWRLPQSVVDTVRALLEVDGLTYRAAAQRTGTTIGTIAGLVHRHDIRTSAMRPTRVAPTPNRHSTTGRKARPTPVNTRHIVLDNDTNTVDNGDPALPIDQRPLRERAWDQIAESIPVPLADHREHTCRWPIGQDSPYLCCALPVADGQRYCPAHYAMAYREAHTRQPGERHEINRTVRKLMGETPGKDD